MTCTQIGRDWLSGVALFPGPPFTNKSYNSWNSLSGEFVRVTSQVDLLITVIFYFLPPGGGLTQFLSQVPPFVSLDCFDGGRRL